MFKRMLGANLAALALGGAAMASEAGSSAAAGGRTGGSSGFANATAHYEGDIGFANSKTHSGEVNFGRGVAIGLDENGLSLSISHALATKFGPAIATNFNLSIDRDGDVSSSHGIAVGEGPLHRAAEAGGATSAGRRDGGATSFARADSDRFGRARAHSESLQSRDRERDGRRHSEPHLIRVRR
jgi:hypothetical protein